MSEEIRRLRLLSYNNLKLIASAMVASAIPSTADAGIVYFDIPDSTVGPSEGLALYNINLTNASVYLSDTISFQGNWLWLETFTPGDGMYLMGSVNFAYQGSEVIPFLEGNTIDGSQPWTNSANLDPSGLWPAGENRYIGLRIDAGGGNYNFGWLSLSFTPGVGGQITGFAFEETFNTEILAGDTGQPSNVVPEPASVAIVTGLFGLMVGANRRARRAKKASAPDALLNLAAGARGVEKFREVNAA